MAARRLHIDEDGSGREKRKEMLTTNPVGRVYISGNLVMDTHTNCRVSKNANPII